MRVRYRVYVVTSLLLLLLPGCIRNAPQATFTPPPSATAVLPPTPTDFIPTATPSPYGWTDEREIMAGLCFESVYDAAGTVFILRTPEELTTLFDLADNSGLCRQPVARSLFDFSGGRILMGLWSRARGCTATHEIVGVTRDDAARRFAVAVRVVAAGNCPYELVQPFWIGLGGMEGYNVSITQ